MAGAESVLERGFRFFPVGLLDLAADRRACRRADTGPDHGAEPPFVLGDLVADEAADDGADDRAALLLPAVRITPEDAARLGRARHGDSGGDQKS